MLLACFCCSLAMWGTSQRYYEQRWKDEFHSLFWALQISISVGIIHLWNYIETHPDFADFELQILKNAGLVMAVLVVRQRFYRFVHSTFFSTEERALWRVKYLRIFSIESTAILFLCFVVVFQPISLKIATYLLIIVLAIVKFLTIKADFKTIFQNLSAFLHFFVYFCTLEIAPIIFCWAFLGKIYD